MISSNCVRSLYRVGQLVQDDMESETGASPTVDGMNWTGSGPCPRWAVCLLTVTGPGEILFHRHRTTAVGFIDAP